MGSIKSNIFLLIFCSRIYLLLNKTLTFYTNIALVFISLFTSLTIYFMCLHAVMLGTEIDSVPNVYSIDTLTPLSLYNDLLL